MAKPVAIRSGSSSTSRDESPAMERMVRVEIGWEDGLGKPARQRSPTRNRLLLPGTAPLRAWRPTWTEIRDPVRPRAPCGHICGGTVGSGWSGRVRGVVRGRGSVGRAGARAAARSGTQRAGGGKGFARATLDGEDMSARRGTDTSDRWRASRLSAPHHRPPSPRRVPISVAAGWPSRAVWA